MADYLDKKVMGGLGAEAVKVIAPNVFPDMTVKKGTEVVLEPVTGNYFPRTLAASAIGGSNVHQSTYCSDNQANRAILTSDGTLIGIGAGENVGAATNAWRLTRWHLYADSSEVEYVGFSNVTLTASFYYSQARLSEFVEVEPDVFVALFFSSDIKTYQVVKVNYDKSTKTSSLSISSVSGHTTTSNNYHSYSDIVANNDGTFFVFGINGICDLWQTIDLTRLNYQLSTGATISNSSNYKNIDSHNNFTSVLPLSDGRFVFTNGGNLLLREWTGSAFNEFGTNSATGVYSSAPLVKIATDVFAMSYANNAGSINWKVVQYDVVTQTLSDVADQVFTLISQTLTSTIQGQGRYGVAGSTFIGWNTDELYAIHFDPETYSIADESQIYISGYLGNRGNLTSFVIRPNGLCTSFMLGGHQVRSSGDAVYMTFNRFTIGNLLPNMAPIPCGIAYADTTPTELSIWVASVTIPGENLQPLSLYGDNIAITADHAIALRNTLSIIERYSYNSGDYSKAGVACIPSEERAANFYGGYAHKSTLNKFRGVREKVKAGASLTAYFSLSGDDGNDYSAATWGVCMDGYQLFSPIHFSGKSVNTSTPTVFAQGGLDIGCFIISRSSAYRDTYLFNKFEVHR
ncbi:hypothetical protein KIH87_03380 [Paraneptunicella aestuarii]|uniref:hypothetical protein n=1 Tax=Paraneptunicella aestuarii TaxID=2831148 RepID=UPI001E3D39F3|nr:hypothetical protein [Paraneptunicella aestuarii]UAA39413.1 hypothetical protein KIH87_03380 [Paraneptunicella aestuarii]